MSFSVDQQKTYRCMTAKAWALHCKRSSINPKDRKAQDQWVRDELEIATQKRSTKDCSSGEDFEDTMAHFEILAEDGIHWQMQQASGGARRILHWANKMAGAA